MNTFFLVMGWLLVAYLIRRLITRLVIISRYKKEQRELSGREKATRIYKRLYEKHKNEKFI